MNPPAPKSLAQLDQYLWTHLLRFVPAYSLGKLWLCGDVALSRCLVHSLRTFDLEYEPWRPLKWPRMIRHFSRLESLSVRLHGSNKAWPRDVIHGVDVDDIPSTVRKLEFHFANDMASFLRPQRAAKANSRAEMIDLRHYFPSLEAFSCSFIFPNAARNVLIPSKFLSPGLTSLVTENYFPVEWEQLALLPKTLTDMRLCLTGDQNWETEAVSFPPHLLRLNVFRVESRHIFRFLPDSLTDLRVELSLANSEEPHNFEFLPSALEIFHIHNLPTITVHLVQKLPSSITDLSILSIGRIDSDMLKHLPPKLEKLNCNRVVDTEFDFVPFLPHTLTSLPIFICNECPATAWQHLPRALKTLNAGNAEANVELFASLPPSITAFTTPNCPAKALDELPFNKLDTLEWRIHAKHEPDEMKPLWRFTQLTVLSLIGHIDPKCLDKAPFCLDSLSINSTYLDIPNLDLQKPFCENLRILKLHFRNAPKFSSDWVARLPQTLTHLEILSFEDRSMKGNILSHVPPRLEHLKLGGFSNFLGKHMEALPKRLQTLSLTGTKCALVDRDLRKLPKSITSLSLPFSEFFDNPFDVIFKHVPTLRYGSIDGFIEDYQTHLRSSTPPPVPHPPKSASSMPYYDEGKHV